MNENLYIVENGSNRFLSSNAHLDGGLAGDDLYYAEYDWHIDDRSKLYKMSLKDGVREYIDSRSPAGGGGPYFCW